MKPLERTATAWLRPSTELWEGDATCIGLRFLWNGNKDLQDLHTWGANSRLLQQMQRLKEKFHYEYMWRFSCPCTTGSKFWVPLTSLQVVHNRWQYWSGSYPELEILHTIFSPSLFRAFQTLLHQLDSGENSVLKVEFNQGGFGSFCQGFRVQWLTRAQQQNFTSCLALERQHALQGKPFRVLVRLHFTRKWWNLRDRWISLNFHLPYIFHQEFLNKVFCQVTGIAEKFFIEFIIHSCDVGKRFLFSFSKERWCTTKAREARKKNQLENQ